jgi:hypothetical protein
MEIEASSTSWWRRINKPLSDHAANLVGGVGLAVFGLTGLIDVADGRSFSMLKVGALVLGIVSLVVAVRMRTRGNRASRGGTHGRKT